MKNKKINVFKLAAAVVLVLLIALTCRVTIIPDPVVETTIDADGNEVAVEQLSFAEQYCADNWDEKIVPTVKERAVEMAELIADTTADLGAAGAKYGYRANETSAWGFCVKAEGKVLELANADSANKVQLLVDLAPYDGAADCKVHFGKVFSTNVKNAIRDGVAFLKLDDFANQVEFADLSTAFNNKVKAGIFANYAPEDLVGKELSVYGCVAMTAPGLDNLVVIPVEMNVAGG